MDIATRLHHTIISVCPINGVSIGDPSERKTWRIDYTSNATPEERTAAQSALAVFDESAAEVPATISDRQFFQAIALAGKITTDEALAAVKTGDIPATLQAVVGALSADQRFAAEMLLSGATIFERSHPMTAALATAMKWSDAEVDDLWRSAAAL